MGVISAPVGRSRSGKRSFSFAYRVEFLQAWDECVERGAKARMLREHNIAWPVVKGWLDARARGDFEKSMRSAAAKSKEPGVNERRAELARLREENQRLREKVAQAEAAQEILGKAFELLEGITKSSAEPSPPIPPALMSVEQYRAWLDGHGLR